MSEATIKDSSGILFKVLSVKTYTLDGNDKPRQAFLCKRPRGKKNYVVFKYEDGSVSAASGIW